ncbi:FAD-dependent oxidoreductase, partial [Paracoccus seriniphilus]
MTAQSGGSIARTEIPEIQGQGQEIAVVGAGIIGVTTAYHLARAGHRVTV